MKIRFGLQIILSLLIFSIVMLQGTRRAEKKYFWTDEGLEIMETCAQPVLKMFSNGADQQCSPSPFYYPIQKAVIGTISSFDESILVKYRALSITSMSLVALLFSFWAFGAAGFGMGLVATVSLFNQEAFTHYSAENRPYALWTLLFLIWLILVFRRARDNAGKVTNFEATSIWIVALALTLIAGSGMLQVGAGIVSIFICWYLHDPKFLSTRRKEVAKLSGLGALCGIIGLYYGARSCTFTDGGPYDLLNTRDIRLIKGVVSLLFYPHGLMHQIEAVLVVLGLTALPLVMIMPKLRSKIADKTMRLSIVLYSQLFITLVIAAAVAVKHYHFSYRIFIHLIICHAFALVLGGWVINDWLRGRFISWRKYGFIILGGLGIVLAVRNWYIEINGFESSQTAITSSKPCKSFQGPLVLYAENLQLADYLNAVVHLNHETKRCGWVGGTNVSEFILVTGDPLSTADWYERKDATSIGAASRLTQCGRPVTLVPH